VFTWPRSFFPALLDRKQDLSLKNKLILLGSRIAVLGQVIDKSCHYLRDEHLGIDSDLYHFMAANVYKYRTLDITFGNYG